MKYVFSKEQLFCFLEDYCGCSFDAAGFESAIKLLDSLVEKKELITTERLEKALKVYVKADLSSVAILAIA